MSLRPSKRPAETTQASGYALLMDSLDDEHALSVVQGALSAAREVGERIVCVPGGRVDAADPALRLRNFAFDLVSQENALGALVLSSALGNAVGPVRLGEWLARYAPLPLVCMGVAIRGQVSARVDNGDGIREAVRHLVKVHGKRNIGFIRGPSQSDEAEDRYAAYRAELTEFGIEHDPRWVAEGDYHRPSGAQAVRTILDQRRVSVHALDALVCANDYMALGALDELTKRGINVPEQVALTGFDDVASAAVSRPALTTVRQPAAELGRTGIKQLLLLAGGGEPTAEQVLAVELKVRRSCGCANMDAGLAERVHASAGAGSFEAALVQRRQLMVAEMARAAHGSFGAAGQDWESGLLGALLEELCEQKYGALGRRTQRLLQRLEQAGSDVTATPFVLSALRRQALPCVAGSPEARDCLEDAIHDAQLVASAVLAQAAAALVRAPARRFRALATQVQTLMFGQDSQLSRALAEHLPSMGVDACVVASLDPHTGPKWQGQMHFGFGPGRRDVEHRRIELSTLQNHPLLEHSRTLFLMPITMQSERLGVALISMSSVRGELLEDLRELFATVLKVAQQREHG